MIAFMSGMRDCIHGDKIKYDSYLKRNSIIVEEVVPHTEVGQSDG